MTSNYYALEVADTRGTVYTGVYTPAAAACPANTGVCSVTPANALSAGTSYSWRISATNSNATTTAIAPMTFSTASGAMGPSVPPAPTLVTPIGTIDTITPRYTWNPSPAATSYELIVQNTAGVAANLTVTAEVANCPSGTCGITPPGSLTNGAAYNWFVRASNSFGTSAWSAPNSITVSVIGPGVPSAPVLIGPSGSVPFANPIFGWNAVSGATGYSIVVQNTMGVAFQQLLDASACQSSGVCNAQPPGPLPSGTYNWFVKAVNSYGASDWSVGMSVTIP